MKDQAGLTILYAPKKDGSVAIQAVADGAPVIEVLFEKERIDEAHILYMEATGFLRSRATMHESSAAIRTVVEKLFAVFGERKFLLRIHLPQSRSGGLRVNLLRIRGSRSRSTSRV